MANDNPQVIKFSNEQVRPLADILVRCLRVCEQTEDNFEAGNLGNAIEAEGAGEIIMDGSETDGRTPLTGGDIYEIINVAQQYQRFINNLSVETKDRLQAILKPHVND